MEPLINPRQPGLFGRRNLILTGRGSRDTPASRFAGPLSVKTALAGEIDWRTQDKQFRVHADAFLLLNRGQEYQLSTNSDGECRTFCAFFEDGFVEQALRSEKESDEALLDEPAESFAFGFFEQLTPMSTPVGRTMLSLAQAVERKAEPLVLDGLFGQLAGELARAAMEVQARPRQLAALRAVTRTEIHRRLLRARAALEADLAAPWTLRTMARAAAMAPHHFARCFSQCFGEAPHRFLARRRLERARALLRSGGFSVTDTCLEVGYRSLGSFSLAYRRNFGCPPSASLNKAEGAGTFEAPGVGRRPDAIRTERRANEQN